MCSMNVGHETAAASSGRGHHWRVPSVREALVTALDCDVRLVTDTTSVVGEPATARSTELASIGLYLVTCLVLVEMWMALWFGSQRAHGSRRP